MSKSISKPKSKSSRPRGFTLLELLVGAAVGAVVLVGISLTFISQARQYQAHASRRGVQANSRQALAFMERHLRIAGFGVDPDRAVLAYDSYNPVTDSQEEGYPDALVVHWRDPLFRRTAQPLSSAMLSLSSTLTEPMRMGQILLIICSPQPNPPPNMRLVNTAPPHAYVTVGAYTAVGQANIPLDTMASAAAPNSPQLRPGRLFHEQLRLDDATSCFQSLAYPPQVVMINRAAFYVAQFDDDGDPVTPERKPYLVMHKGLDMPNAVSATGDGVIDADDAVPVAEGIEQLQAAYILDTNLLDTPPVGDNVPIILGVNQLMGTDHYGENWESILVPSTYASLPLPSSFYNAANVPRSWFISDEGLVLTPTNIRELMRLTDLPSNLRQVRLTLVARSSVADPQIPGDNLLAHEDGSPYPDGPILPDPGNSKAWRHLENLSIQTPAADFVPRGGHYYRTILRQTVAPKNLLMSRQFVPVNVKGGG